MRISKPLRRLKLTSSFSRALKALSPGGGQLKITKVLIDFSIAFIWRESRALPALVSDNPILFQHPSSLTMRSQPLEP